ncbi:non-ribosomal peptide synthetase [Marinobacterium jannaschii]|uniref:non-ribosomal peptide synthetase n=1 Tax=Marinobacterium jannaschii TaxID=64970 RepID=UPI0004861E84|nr:non-ribosomal peptide synthetase [Marinobacterium jannaschii]
MSDAISLLKQCWLRGINLSLKDDKLSFKAAPGVMDQTMLAEIRQHKTGLISALQAQPDYFEPRPLSANERALWFLYRMAPDSAAYNMAYAVKLSVGISEAAINQAFATLLARHPILCTPYGERDGEPLQWARAVTPGRLEARMMLDAGAEQLQQWISEEADRPLVLESGQICRAALAINQTEQGAEPHLVLVVHHIAADFISFEVLRQEFLQLLGGKTPAQAAAYSYRDWAVQQQLALRQGEKSREYWLAELEGLPQLQLPTDFRPGSDTRAEGEEISFVLAEPRAAQLRQQCRDLGITPYVWWLSAFQWFMARLSGQDDFLIGTPSAGRLKPEHSRLVGYLVNPLPLRCQPQWEQSFADWSGQVAQQVKRALSHQAYPFAALVEQLEVQREAGRSPVFQHMFTLNHERPEAGKAGLIEAELLAEQRGAAHELNLVVVDDRSCFTGKWRYNNSLYRRESAERIRESFLCFVSQLLDDNQQALHSLTLASDENVSILQGEPLAPLADSAWQAFANHCAQRPDAIALQQGSDSLSYAELMQRVESAAAQLHSDGIQAGERIGICLERSIGQVVLMLASWRLGAAYVALDGKWPEGRLQFVAEDAQLKLIAGAGERPDWLADACHWFSPQAISAGTAAITEVAPAQAGDAAYLIYTSGSTGQPKGVVLSQSNLIHYASAVIDRLALDADASLATLASNGADLGYTALYGALLSGRTLRLLPEDLAFDAEALADELAQRPVDCLKIVPSHLNGLLLASPRAELLPRCALVTGGEALTPDLIARIKERSPQLALFNHYGPTETTVGVVMKRLDAAEPVVALGQPLANVQLRIVDSCGQPLPQGFAGELEVAGPTLAAGYLGQPEMTAERFYQAAGLRWYRTGDRVMQVAGELQFIGRCDFQVKIRGYRVEPGEVESWLKQQADDAVVINAPDERGNNRLVAYLVADQTALDVLRQEMAAVLPDYMVPAVWIALDQLPLLGNGKVDRKALPDPDQQPETAVESLADNNGEPRNSTEAALLTIWRELLGKPELGIHDNFFANGGDSILGLQIIAKARPQQITLTPKAIFEHQTVAELAAVAETPQGKLQQALLEIARDVLGKPDLSATDNFFAVGGDSILSLQIIAKARAAGIALTPKQVFEHQSMAELAQVASLTEQSREAESKPQDLLPTEPFPLTPIQHWFFQQQSASQTPSQLGHWNQSLLLDSQLDIDLPALRAASLKLAERHPSLRLRFIQHEGQWLQQYQPLAQDWAERLATECRSDQLDDQLLAQLQSGFNLDSAPLLKLVWLPQQRQLLCTAHHLIVDAVSWQILLTDLAALYAAELGDAQAPVAVDAVRFHQWQQQLVERTAAIDTPQARHYWQQQVQPELPRSAADNCYGNSAAISTRLDAATTARLLGEANGAYNSRVQELLLTALARLLGQWQQLPEICIELEGHGREAAESGLDLSASIGWFTSRYPQKLSAAADWASALIHNKEQLRRLPGNGLDYGLLRYLATDSDSWPQHSFVSFNYLGQQEQASERPFSLATALCPGMRADENQRPHLLDINALVLAGELHIEWSYPASDPAFARVPMLAEDYLLLLQRLLDHCCDPANGRATAADFPDAGISDAEFIDLLAELEA